MRSKIQSEEAYWTHRTDIDHADQPPKRKIELMLPISEKTWPGETCAASRPVSWPEETAPRNPQASYYRARYYDLATGRFLSEDPRRFRAGMNFYNYVSGNPIRSTDPMGLSSRDVQRILQKCKKCTDNMSKEGRRLSGSGVIMGWLNDFVYWFSSKRESCYGQATVARTCLDDPSAPYDDHWTFEQVPIWFGSHQVVEGYSSNLSDPIVVCDPWLNESYTTPSLGQMLVPNNNEE
jgi:RHS repeat-associated protein